MHSRVALVHQVTNTGSYKAECHLLSRGGGGRGSLQRCWGVGTRSAEAVGPRRRTAQAQRVICGASFYGETK